MLQACKLGPCLHTCLHLVMRDVANHHCGISISSSCIRGGGTGSARCLSCEEIATEEQADLRLFSLNPRDTPGSQRHRRDTLNSPKDDSPDEPRPIYISDDLENHNARTMAVSGLRMCMNTQNLMQGKVYHAMAVEYGIENKVERLLLQMYAKCRALDDALLLFDAMHEQSITLWNLMITVHLKEGKFDSSLLFYGSMQRMSLMATKVTYICMLSACSSSRDLVFGIIMHCRIIACQFSADVVVTTSLVYMYGNCANLEDACRVFDNADERDVISWNAMIATNRQHAMLEESAILFNQMQMEGFIPNKVTFVSLLDVCSQQKALGEGKHIHIRLMALELTSDVSIGTAVISMYGKCSHLDEANFMFENFQGKDVVLWNAMLTLYSQCEDCKNVFRLLEQMICEGFMPTKVTYISIFNVCTSKDALSQGVWMHARMVNSLFETDLEVGNAIINFYSKHHSPLNATRVFEKISKRNVITWSGMIALYAQCGLNKQAVQVFIEMHHDSVMANEVTLVCILQAFDGMSMPDGIRKTHCYAMLEGFNKDVTLATALINMYSKYGSIKEARSVFDEIPKPDILCWTAIITSYVQHGQQREALYLFDAMKKEGILADKVAIVNILSACSHLVNFSECEEMFTCIQQCRLELDEAVGSAVVSMYGRFGKLKLCQGLFEQLPKTHVNTWNAMIVAYVQNGQFRNALHLFEKMNDAGVVPDKDTFVSTLAACASETSLIHGERIHEFISKFQLKLNDALGGALISMYGKCGCLWYSENVFNNVRKEDVISWNAMIGACAQHGESLKALQLVEQMQEKGVTPDTITIISFLNAMSHTGLLYEAYRCISLMVHSFGIAPSSDHYVCIMDSIRRTGKMDEVECFIRCMPFQPKTISYMSFLGACRSSINVEHGKFAAKHMSELDPENAGPYVSLSNIYASTVEE